jgi:uncharacterized protein HemX
VTKPNAPSSEGKTNTTGNRALALLAGALIVGSMLSATGVAQAQSAMGPIQHPPTAA